jgi:hypothetical protein
MKHWWIRKIVGFVAGAALILIVLGGIVMVLWNAILPDLLQTPEITYWQAVGLLALTHILFRGVGHFGYRRSWKGRHWKAKFEEKLASMKPEEREAFRQEWKRRCGWDPDAQDHSSKDTHDQAS